MKRNQEVVETAKKWRDLLSQRASSSYSFELAQSALIDLAAAIGQLIEENDSLAEQCKDRDILEKRVRELSKPQPIKKANGNEVKDAVA